MEKAVKEAPTDLKKKNFKENNNSSSRGAKKAKDRVSTYVFRKYFACKRLPCSSPVARPSSQWAHIAFQEGHFLAFDSMEIGNFLRL